MPSVTREPDQLIDGEEADIMIAGREEKEKCEMAWPSVF